MIAAERASSRAQRARDSYDIAQLDRSIQELREVLGDGAGDLPFRAACRANLGVALLSRYGMLGNTSDLEESVACARAGVEQNSSGLARIKDVANLAMVLDDWFLVTGDVEDLDESIRMHREACRLCLEPEHRTSSRLRATLGNLSGIDSLSTQNHAVTAQVLFHASIALRTRFLFFRLIDDLDASIEIASEAVDITRTLRYARQAGVKEYGRIRAMSLSELAARLQERFDLTGDEQDLNRAIRCLEEAHTKMPRGEAEVALVTMRLAAALGTRGSRRQSESDMESALAMLAQAVDEAERWPELGPELRMTEADILLDRAQLTGSLADLDRAAELLETLAGQFDNSSPQLCSVLINLAKALERRAGIYGTPEPGPLRRRAAVAWQAAADLAAAPVRRQLEAACGWGRRAMADAPGSETAAQAYARAVELLPVVAWRGLDRTSQERVLKDAGEAVASDAAAAQLAAGHPDRALELLELGRGVLWSQTLDIRTDLQAIEAADRELARELTRVRTLLEGELHRAPGRDGASATAQF
ncbi:tetratricopeptide repeat protein [Streptomyces sp. ADMS]|uniref:tetratricopeptide repeat protein n=1 Tax=Streptomyces sp. ADMS TaxID=3071415 RepID=UPI00297005B9|nr:tetratricopeptide repeat protein [Streptomyces sp. ADMS]MDW4907086.1 tetratricopeptide repeat protein [Streptomyces sp. ADMS]